MKESKSLINIIKNPKIILLVILLLAIILRVIFFNTPQAVWWDEAEYLSTAKHWALGTPYEVSQQRQPLIPILLSIFYFIGISNLAILKFLTIVIPSILAVLAVYLLGKEMYNKKIALIASFIMSVCWIPIFWTTRFSTDLLGLTLGLFGFFFFYKYTKNKKLKYILLTALFLGLGFLTRVGNILPIAIVIAFLIITEHIKVLKDKNLYYALGLGILVMVPYLIWNYLTYGKIMAFWSGYFGQEVAADKFARPIAWNLLNLFQNYSQWLFFIFFLIGLITLINLIIGFDLIYKKQNKELKSDLFTILMILIPMFFFIFIERAAEPRWAIIMSAAIFFLIAKGLMFIYKIIKNYNKQIALIFILIVLIAGAIPHITLAKNLIDSKKDSYLGLKLSGEWMKQNSNPEDIIYSSAVPQHSFYSERLVKGMPSKEQFEEKIKELKPKFFVISQFERSPEWVYSYPQENPDKLQFAEGLFMDPEKTKPLVLIYEIKS